MSTGERFTKAACTGRVARRMLRRLIERKGDTGLRQVISLKSGAPLRVQGNEVPRLPDRQRHRGCIGPGRTPGGVCGQAPCPSHNQSDSIDTREKEEAT
jgi:hypothetical protein